MEQTVTFIGDKTLETPNGFPDHNLSNVVRTELQLVIEDLYKEHKCIFLTAIEPGFDMLAAEVVLECAKQYKSIELHAIIPFPGYEECYSDADRLRYKRIYEAAISHTYIRDEYSEDAYRRTTEYLISNSSEVVLFNRKPNPDVMQLAGEKAWNVYDTLDEYFAIQSPIKDFLQNYPNVTSFQYGRKGLCFTLGEWLISPAFEDMTSIREVTDELRLSLNDGTRISASLVTDRVSFDPLPKIKLDVSGLSS